MSANPLDPSRIEDLCYLAEKGLVIVCSYPGDAVNFGQRVDGASGVFPYACPFDAEGNYIDAGPSRRMVVDMQQLSVVDAYRLGKQEGYEAGRKG